MDCSSGECRFSGNSARPARIAVVIPCFNEGISIARVVREFKEAVPGATIYVCDNSSSDNTADEARHAGAEVFTEKQKGKGYAVRRLFRLVDADYYILVDGDATYDPSIAPSMITKAIAEGFDLVNCIRMGVGMKAYRTGHQLGNKVLTNSIRLVFGNQAHDILSGYKVLSRRFVKSFPMLTNGFDVETEIAVHALELALPIGHVEGRYISRPEGSHSKLNTYRDGLKILFRIFILIKHERPVQLFSLGAAVGLSFAFLLAYPLAIHYLATGLVPRMPTALLAVAITIVSALLFMTGLILDSVTRGRKEARMIAYLQA
ncbi:MAG TPA: glycosyltransferase family 2 protein [Acidocella sp.]|nr:glycosyltransferase family 2 protein [Acidocella sp.]